MRLNLASGGTRFPGYISVDLHGGDVKCDILALPKEWAGKADEVMCIHGLEHLAFYQTQDALLEWKRVLKPGGKLVIEVPNLKEACRNFLLNPGKLNRGLHCIYGDQDYANIEAVHKSGWTPETLIDALTMAGFRNCAQRPAEHKRKEPRDFRVEAYKP